MKLVLLGASAGGLEPLESFFSKIPKNTEFTFIVIQHLASNHKSLMNELLARKTSLPINVVDENTKLKKGEIYLNTSENIILFEDKNIKLQKRDTGHLEFPINKTLTSAAEEFGNQCAGIILSGTGSDGSQGLKSLKEHGGLALVENPDEAKFSGKPNSAIRTNSIDAIVKVDEMYQQLERFFFKNYKGEGQSLNNIIAEINKVAKVDFSGYKETTIKRRVERRLIVRNAGSFNEYYDILKNDKEELLFLAQDLLIGVTKLFRDKDAFKSLEENVLPELVNKLEPHSELRVWVPGCSTGEEAYTFAIILHRFLKNSSKNFNITIFATDLDTEAIKSASNPVYNKGIVDDIPKSILREYFIPKDGGYVPVNFLRKMIVFSSHNLLQDPPFSKIDLLSCRNLLIYLKPKIQNKILQSFRYSLKTNGFLFLGSSETLGPQKEKFEEIDRKWKIFQNKQHLAFPELISPQGNNIKSIIGVANFAQSNSSLSNVGVKNIHEKLIQEFLPTTIVLNQSFAIEHVVGNVDDVLSFKKGQFSNHISHLLPEGWSVPVEIALTKLRTNQGPIKIDKLRLSDGQYCDLLMKKLDGSSHIDNHYACVIYRKKDKVIEDVETINISGLNSEKLKIIEQELKNSKENLQSNIEELASSNEELHTANEELQSSNEELESLNEELYTVNGEYQIKVDQLENAHNDLTNLLNHSDVSIIFLNENLKITNFTNTVSSFLDINNNDKGRSIFNFNGEINFIDYEDKINSVLETFRPAEFTVKTKSNKVYIMKLNPFITTKNVIKGIVISLSDISQLTKTKGDLFDAIANTEKLDEQLQEKQENYRLITEYSNDLILLHDNSGILTFASPSSLEITGYTAEELEGENIMKFINKKDKGAKKKIHSLVDFENHSENFVRFIKKDKSEIWLHINAELIVDENNQKTLLTTCRDVSKNMKLIRQIETYETIIKKSHDSIIITDKTGGIMFFNEAAEKQSGYKFNEVKGKKPGDFLQGPDTNQKDVLEIAKALAELQPVQKKLLNYTKTGEKYWTDILIQPLMSSNNEFLGFFSVQRDITEIVNNSNNLKEYNNKLKHANNQLEDFAYIISHDLKEPAKGVLGLMQLLSQGDGVSEAEQNKIVAMANTASKRMVGMIDSILAYSRTGRPKEERKLVSLLSILNTAKAALNHRSQKIDMEFKFPKKDTSVWAYSQTLSQLVQNLFSNAIKYRKEDTKLIIQVSIQATENKHIISVSDNGTGIAPENHQKIFEIFNRVTDKNKDESHGIGLATCKRIADLHGGDIYVESELNKGSTFTFAVEKLD